MGHLQHKYTSAYFTGIDANGASVDYGLGVMYNDTCVRDIDQSILDKIEFYGLRVLELGYGRGEVIRYLADRDIKSYVGLDFAPPAYDIASAAVPQGHASKFKLFLADALDHLQAKNYVEEFDVVIAFDFIEHVPRVELGVILDLLRKALAKNSLLLINTPAYLYDNDVLRDGIDSRNHTDAVDLADFIPETEGMHCNKYSIESLQLFLQAHGYSAISEAHIFTPTLSCESTYLHQRLSYADRLQQAIEAGLPLDPDFSPDVIEYAYRCEQPSIYQHNCFDKTYNILSSTPTLPYEDSAQTDRILRELLPPGSCVFDVGGYIGLSSLSYSSIVGSCGKVICFEPNFSNLNRILNNLSLNPVASKSISVHALGLSDCNQSLKLLTSPNIDNGHSSTSQLLNGGRTAIPQSELRDLGFVETDIECLTLDSFVEATGLSPDFIKIDIEGAESNFLFGALDTISSKKPILLFELHNVLAASIIIPKLLSFGYETKFVDAPWGNRTQLLFLPSSQSSLVGKRLYSTDPYIVNSVQLLLYRLNNIERSLDTLAASNHATQESLVKFLTLLDNVTPANTDYVARPNTFFTHSIKIKFTRIYLKANQLLLRLTSKLKRSTRTPLSSSAHSVFNHIFETNYWGDKDSRSGGGSNLIQTQTLRAQLPALLSRYHVTHLLDLPCGDYFWMSQVSLECRYLGADIVPQLIKSNLSQYSSEKVDFVQLDGTTDPLPSFVDAVFCRDMLVHLSYADIRRFLINLKASNASYLFTTHFSSRESNSDIVTGQWRPLNLCKAPFFFPEPLELINENCTEYGDEFSDKSIGVWSINDLPVFS